MKTEFVITPEFVKEMTSLIRDFQQGGMNAIGEERLSALKKFKAPAAMTRGSECTGCVSCGACPVVHIKAGYLLAAFHVG